MQKYLDPSKCYATNPNSLWIEVTLRKLCGYRVTYPLGTDLGSDTSPLPPNNHLWGEGKTDPRVSPPCWIHRPIRNIVTTNGEVWIMIVLENNNKNTSAMTDAINLFNQCFDSYVFCRVFPRSLAIMITLPAWYSKGLHYTKKFYCTVDTRDVKLMFIPETIQSSRCYIASPCFRTFWWSPTV